MKVNILLNDNHIINGYLNIDPYKEESSKVDKVNVDFENLDAIVDDGELEELRAINILEYVDGNKVDAVLKNWTKKLAHKGKIIIGFTDIMEISKAITNRAIDIPTANDLIHGKQLTKKNSFDINTITNYLSSLNLKIISKRLVSYWGVVIAERE